MFYEDRLAKYILAILYSSEHIDVTFSLNNPERIKLENEIAHLEEDLVQTERQYHLTKAEIEELLSQKEQPEKRKLIGPTQKRSKTLGARIKKLAKQIADERHKRNQLVNDLLQMELKAIEAYYDSIVKKEISLMFRVLHIDEHTGEPKEVELSHYDTVAVAIVNKTWMGTGISN